MESRLTIYPHLTYYAHTDTDCVREAHFERHCHDHCELLYVLHGEGRLVVEGAEYPLQPNTVFLIRPYEFHYVRPKRGTRYERCVLEFDAAFSEGAAANLPFLSREDTQTYGVYFSPDQIGDEIRELFLTLDTIGTMFVDAPDRQAKEETMMRSCVTQLLLRLSLPEPGYRAPAKGDLCVEVLHSTMEISIHQKYSVTCHRQLERFCVSRRMIF